jgi:hypothetical protein
VMSTLKVTAMVLTTLTVGCATTKWSSEEAADVAFRRLLDEEGRVGAQIEYLRWTCDGRYRALTNYVAGDEEGRADREKLIADRDFMSYLQLRQAELALLAKEIGLIDRIRLRLLCSGDTPPIRRTETNVVRRVRSQGERSLPPCER